MTNKPQGQWPLCKKKKFATKACKCAYSQNKIYGNYKRNIVEHLKVIKMCTNVISQVYEGTQQSTLGQVDHIFPILFLEIFESYYFA